MKQVASHFGGSRNPMVVSWPKVIRDKGGIRSQFFHLIDVVPTILEATGIQMPDYVDGVAQRPIGREVLYEHFYRPRCARSGRPNTLKSFPTAPCTTRDGLLPTSIRFRGGRILLRAMRMKFGNSSI